MIPHAISLLDHVRTGFLESDQDFTSRRQKADDERARLEHELGDKRRRLAQAQTAVRQDLQVTCNSFRSRFTAASNDQILQQVSADFSESIANVIRSHLTKIGQDAVPNVEGLDADIQRVVRDTNRMAGVAATIATAALGAIIIPGVGAGASAAEGTASAAARAGASKTAASAVGTKAASAVAQKAAGASVFATGAQAALKALHELNPVNIVSDFVAEWWKGAKIDEPMDQIRTELSSRVASEIESYFEQEVFQRLEGERDDVQPDAGRDRNKTSHGLGRPNLRDRSCRCGHRKAPHGIGRTRMTTSRTVRASKAASGTSSKSGSTGKTPNDTVECLLNLRSVRDQFKDAELDLSNDKVAHQLEDLEERLVDHLAEERDFRDGVGLLTVAVVGDFNSGKSTFINALLGTEICPVGDEPTTASVTHFIHGNKQTVRA